MNPLRGTVVIGAMLTGLALAHAAIAATYGHSTPELTSISGYGGSFKETSFFDTLPGHFPQGIHSFRFGEKTDRPIKIVVGFHPLGPAAGTANLTAQHLQLEASAGSWETTTVGSDHFIT